jgi:hypothetical protein
MQTAFFFGWNAVICYAFFLMLGSVGFSASMLFVRHIYRYSHPFMPYSKHVSDFTGEACSVSDVALVPLCHQQKTLSGRLFVCISHFSANMLMAANVLRLAAPDRMLLFLLLCLQHCLRARVQAGQCTDFNNLWMFLQSHQVRVGQKAVLWSNPQSTSLCSVRRGSKHPEDVLNCCRLRSHNATMQLVAWGMLKGPLGLKNTVQAKHLYISSYMCQLGIKCVWWH